MVVLHTTTLGWGGTEGHVVDLASGFRRLGLPHCIIVDEPPLDRIGALNQLGSHVRLVSPGRGVDESQYRPNLTEILKSLAPRLVHVNAWKRRNHIFETTRQLGIPTVETIHATVKYNWRWRYLICRHPIAVGRDRLAYRRADPFVINVSDLSNAQFRKQYPFISRTVRIYCGAELPSCPNEIGSTNDLTVLWIGSLIARKRPRLALQTWRNDDVRATGARLVLIGDGPERQWLQREAESISDRVVLAGAVPDLRPYLSEASVLMCTSTDEGIPKSIRYAMNFGIPVVSSAVGAIPEVLTDGCHGFLFEPEDSLKMEEGLVALLTNASLRQELGRNARRQGESLFDLDRMTKDVIQVYERVAGSIPRVEPHDQTGSVPSDLT